MTCFLPVASWSHLPSAVGKIHPDTTLYFSSNNPELCVLEQSFTVAQGVIATLLFTAQSWLMTFLTESGKYAYSREWTQEVTGEAL